MNNLSSAVQEAIQKDLPGLVAGELKDFIVAAEDTANKLQRRQEELAASQREVQILRDTLAQHRDIAVREAEVEKQVKAVQEKEMSLLRREAALEGKLAYAELQGVKDTMSHFLRNVTVRQNVVADVAKAVDGMPGNGQGTYGTPGHLVRDQRPDTTTTTSIAE